MKVMPAGVRGRLILLAAACTLPVFVLLMYDTWRAGEDGVESARAELGVRAKSAAADLGRDLLGAVQLLQSMAEVPAVADVRSAACSRQLVLLARPYTQIGNAIGISADGRITCGASAESMGVSVADRDYFTRALASSGPVVGGVVASRARADRYVLPVALAVRDSSGRARGVLTVAINLTEYGRNAAAAWTDPGTAVVLWDRTATVAFRWPDPGATVGRSAAGTELGRRLFEQTAGHFEATGIDGLERVHGFVPLGDTGLKLSYSLPRDVLLAPHRAAFARNVALLALIAIAGFGLAWLLGERLIRRPLARLASVASRMGAGELGARSSRPYARDEVGVVARAFDAMADRVEAQITALRTSEHRVRQQLEHMNLLDQITRSIGERLDLQSIFQVVVRTLEDSLPVDFCCIALHDPEDGTLRVARIGVKSAALSELLALPEQGVIGVDNNGLGRCMAGHLVYEPDIAGVRFPFPERLAKGGLRALVLAPLRSESQVFGVVVAARRAPGSFTSVECEFLRQLSEHVALGAGQARLHGALQQAYDDLRQTQQVVMQEERLRALGQMASGIAHDINNALSPVSLYTESMLETEKGLSERARGYLQTILRAVEDVAQTVARMREFYRKREVQAQLSPVDVNKLVQQVLDLTRARWSDMPLQKGVVIRGSADLAAGLPAIMGVESEIREALTNLVFNAVDAMPEGGALTLRTRLVDAGGEKEAGVAVEVVDDGIGMDENTRRRCLEPFFTTKGERGTGLGLAMVFGAVQRHSALLEIDSAPGAGTTMRLVFAVSTAVAAEALDPALGAGAVASLRLLLIDDDPVILKSLRDSLEVGGHRTVTASGGKEGIDAFRQALERGERFAAVFTDLGMPHIDGRRVAAAIKEMSPATPVILLTGWGQRLVSEGEVPPFVDRVLSKPPKLREVREALAALCRDGVSAA